MFLAHGQADSDPEDHERGPVVDQTLSAKDCHLPARQGTAECGDRRRVRGRDRRAKHPSRTPVHPETVCDDRGRRYDERCAEQRNGS